MRPIAFLPILATILLSFCVVAAQKPAKPMEMPGAPEGQGVFCRTEISQWVKLELAPIADIKPKGMKRFLETDGLASLNMIITYKGANAAIQISNAWPVFFVRGVGSVPNALIVRLTQKKDSREAYAASADTTYENKGGYKASEIRRLLVTPYSKDTFSATPEEELKTGEYLITFGNTNAAYDFGITSAGK